MKKIKKGWRLDGIRIYKVKGVKKSRKKTYPSKLSARKTLSKRGKKHKTLFNW